MRPITSREYKLMLRASKFNGDEAELMQSAGALWGDLAAIIVPNAVTVSGIDDIKQKQRRIRFFDTEDKWLRAHGYVARERVDLNTDERQVTLKFRHPDRYISQDRNMDPADGFAKDLKFEEDIKPPFQALYSFSSNTTVEQDTPLKNIEDLNELYPGLANAVDELPKKAPLSQVGDFTAYERVVKGTSFQIRKDPEASAVCSLTVWYANEGDGKPVVAEFSFKYEDDKEAYTAKMATRAYESFIAIQEKLDDWIDTESMTKTAYVYWRATR